MFPKFIASLSVFNKSTSLATVLGERGRGEVSLIVVFAWTVRSCSYSLAVGPSVLGVVEGNGTSLGTFLMRRKSMCPGPSLRAHHKARGI